MSSHDELGALVAAAYEDRGLIAKPEHAQAVHEVIGLLDRGEVRVAQPTDQGWTVNTWAKQAILLYFGLQDLVTHEVGPFEYFDKIPLKRNWEKAGVRCVPPATARYGAFIESGASNSLNSH